MRINEPNIILKAAQQFGTPLFLYDGEHIRKTYRTLKKIVPKNMDIFYSMKANPLLGICQLLNNEKSCCEVCSLAELQVAIKSGFDPHDIIFVGPGKTIQEWEACIQKQIYAIVCESIDEIRHINDVAKSFNRVCPILLRINPDFIVNHAPLKMGGKATQFGIDLSILQNYFKEIILLPNIKIRGIHIYNGTRILDADSIATNTIHILKLAEHLSEKYSLPFECIDIGGGFGIPYFEDENKLDVNRIFSQTQLYFDSYLKKFPNTRLILECGRYLVGACGMLITKVLTTKTSHEENFIVTDAGMDCHMAAAGIGSFMRRNFAIDHVSYGSDYHQPLKKYNITGPLCTPGDVIAKQMTLNEVKTGDFILIKNSGAYGPTASPGRFLSRGFPAEVLFDDDELHLLRRRETASDILSTQFDLIKGKQNAKHKKSYRTSISTYA